MSILNIVELSLFGGCTLVWLLFLARAGYHGSAIESLQDKVTPFGGRFPRLSLVIAARDEAETIGGSLATLLVTDYPDLEIIVVDDRSTDGTSAIVDRLASEHPILKVAHIESLPPGWLGKVNALEVGRCLATGDWLLFADADIHFENDVLRKAIAFAESESLDHMALLPETTEGTAGFWLTVLVFAFGAMFVQRIRAAHVSKQASEAFCGVGAFNLVRRLKFDETPGFGWLRMEVLDDVGLGLMMKRAGGKSAVLSGAGLVHLAWYHSLRGAIAGLEKNAFAGFARFSFLRATVTMMLMLATVVIPICVALLHQSVFLLLVAFASYCLVPAAAALILQGKPVLKPIVALFLPVGYLLLTYAFFRSALQARVTGGIRWRDTFYPIDELKAGQRVKL